MIFFQFKPLIVHSASRTLGLSGVAEGHARSCRLFGGELRL
ncbi:MAG: hypothetical protein AB1898_30475 [Acidobacteriota bacterium]